jgi:hypothetical protein
MPICPSSAVFFFNPYGSFDLAYAMAIHVPSIYRLLNQSVNNHCLGEHGLFCAMGQEQLRYGVFLCYSPND